MATPSRRCCARNAIALIDRFELDDVSAWRKYGVFPKYLVLHIIIIAVVTAQASYVYKADGRYSMNVHNSWATWLYPDQAALWQGNSLTWPGDVFFVNRAAEINSTIHSAFSNYFVLQRSPGSVTAQQAGGVALTAGARGATGRVGNFDDLSQPDSRLSGRMQRSVAAAAAAAGRGRSVAARRLSARQSADPARAIGVQVRLPALDSAEGTGQQAQIQTQARAAAGDITASLGVLDYIETYAAGDPAIAAPQLSYTSRGNDGSSVAGSVSFTSLEEFLAWANITLGTPSALAAFVQRLQALRLDLSARVWNPAGASLLSASACTVWTIGIVMDMEAYGRGAAKVSLDDDFNVCDGAWSVPSPTIALSLALLVLIALQQAILCRNCSRTCRLISWAVVLGKAARHHEKRALRERIAVAQTRLDALEQVPGVSRLPSVAGVAVPGRVKRVGRREHSSGDGQGMTGYTALRGNEDELDPVSDESTVPCSTTCCSLSTAHVAPTALLRAWCGMSVPDEKDIQGVKGMQAELRSMQSRLAKAREVMEGSITSSSDHKTSDHRATGAGGGVSAEKAPLRSLAQQSAMDSLRSESRGTASAAAGATAQAQPAVQRRRASSSPPPASGTGTATAPRLGPLLSSLDATSDSRPLYSAVRELHASAVGIGHGHALHLWDDWPLVTTLANALLLGYGLWSVFRGESDIPLGGIIILGLGAAGQWWSILRVMRYRGSCALFSRTAGRALPLILRNIAVSIPIFMAFACAGSAIFGGLTERFDGIAWSSIALFAVANGDVVRETFQVTLQYQPTAALASLAQAFMYVYALLFVLVVLKTSGAMTEEAFLLSRVVPVEARGGGVKAFAVPGAGAAGEKDSKEEEEEEEEEDDETLREEYHLPPRIRRFMLAIMAVRDAGGLLAPIVKAAARTLRRPPGGGSMALVLAPGLSINGDVYEPQYDSSANELGWHSAAAASGEGGQGVDVDADLIGAAPRVGGALQPASYARSLPSQGTVVGPGTEAPLSLSEARGMRGRSSTEGSRTKYGSF